jgi:hypothetical protein
VQGAECNDGVTEYVGDRVWWSCKDYATTCEDDDVEVDDDEDDAKKCFPYVVGGCGLIISCSLAT